MSDPIAITLTQWKRSMLRESSEEFVVHGDCLLKMRITDNIISFVFTSSEVEDDEWRQKNLSICARMCTEAGYRFDSANIVHASDGDIIVKLHPFTIVGTAVEFSKNPKHHCVMVKC